MEPRIPRPDSGRRGDAGTSGARAAQGPTLAVVITCYNYEAYVGRAIRSVLDQAHGDCELIVVDDGSADRSWDEIRRHGVTAVRTENAGQRAACVAGLERTEAPFVLFLDADDELMPGALERIIGRLDTQVAKLQFPLVRIDADGCVIGAPSPVLPDDRGRDDFVRQVLRNGVYKTPPTSGNVFRRDVCALLREATYDRAVDGVILFAAPFFGDVVSLEEPLGRYRIHDRNDSGLGRLPEPISMKRDIDRFVQRHDHLREVIQRLGYDEPLVDPQSSFYFQERMLCLAVASGHRPALSRLPRLIKALRHESHSAKVKAALAIFALLATALPNSAARRLLSYRLGPRRRPSRLSPPTASRRTRQAAAG